MSKRQVTIKVYKWHGMWLLDKERDGIDKEPFPDGRRQRSLSSTMPSKQATSYSSSLPSSACHIMQ
jgi:hypothetical protein